MGTLGINLKIHNFVKNGLYDQQEQIHLLEHENYHNEILNLKIMPVSNHVPMMEVFLVQ
jgi:hypothetical protein